MFLDVHYRLAAMYKIMSSVYSNAASISVAPYYDTAGIQRTTLYYYAEADTVINAVKTQTSYATDNRWNIIVGSGTTPVTSSDNKVESEITDGLTAAGVSYDEDRDKGVVTINKTMRNTGDEELVIREIGIASALGYSASGVASVLIYREVLENPIAVAPGESFTVSITRQFPVTG